jgi:hypothetical protein
MSDKLNLQPMCPHEQFNVQATVEGMRQGGQVRRRLVAQVTCATCGLPFQFYGASLDYKAVAPDNLSLRWPIAPTVALNLRRQR